MLTRFPFSSMTQPCFVPDKPPCAPWNQIRLTSLPSSVRS